MILEFEKRTHDWMVYLVGNKAVWDCGPTLKDAIRSWVSTHGKDHGGSVPSVIRGQIQIEG